MKPSFRFSKKRVRKSPSGKKVVKFKTKKPGKALCGICNAKLNAVPNRRPPELSKLAKTQKRPERVFGGVLCHACTRRIIKEQSRVASGAIAKSEVDFRDLKYLKYTTPSR